MSPRKLQELVNGVRALVEQGHSVHFAIKTEVFAHELSPLGERKLRAAVEQAVPPIQEGYLIPGCSDVIPHVYLDVHGDHVRGARAYVAALRKNAEFLRPHQPADAAQECAKADRIEAVL